MGLLLLCNVVWLIHVFHVCRECLCQYIIIQHTYICSTENEAVQVQYAGQWNVAIIGSVALLCATVVAVIKMKMKRQPKEVIRYTSVPAEEEEK